MDTKLIREYGADILSYRFRTARQRKRARYEDFDKQLIQLNRERHKLLRQIWNLGWEPLVPPVQKGWKRCFVLRPDVARSRHADFFETILKKINTHDWSHRKDFKVKKRRKGRKYYIVKTQFLRKLYKWEMKKIDFSAKELQYFHEVWESDWRRQQVKRYVFTEPWRFVLQVRPNIIDKVKKRDPVLEARKNEISRWFDRNGYCYRLDKLRGGRYTWWKDEDGLYADKNILRNKTFQQILSEAKAEYFDYRL